MSFFQLVKPGTHIDFVRYAKVCAVLSVLLISAGLISTHSSVRGVRYGIDFAGGTELQLRFLEEFPVDEGMIRGVLTESGVEDPSVVRFGEEGSREYLVRFMTAEEEGDTGDLVEALRLKLVEGIGAMEVDRVEFVGPRVGAELRADGLKALFYAGILVLVYIWFRFSVRFAPGAIAAILHDVLITAGLWVILGFEFDLRVLAALLAIVGYSLNDSIIVYDRIRENMELHTKQDLPDVINRSVNQTLSRTVLTSATTLLAVVSLWIVGGEVIRPFAIAMVIGILVGTYSSIYIAAPTLLVLERWLGGDGQAAKKGRAGAKRPAARKRAKAS